MRSTVAARLHTTFQRAKDALQHANHYLRICWKGVSDQSKRSFGAIIVRQFIPKRMKTGYGYYPPPAARTSKPLPPLPPSAKSEATEKRASNQFAAGIKDSGLRLPRTTSVDTDVTESATPGTLCGGMGPHGTLSEVTASHFHLLKNTNKVPTLLRVYLNH